MLARLSWRYKQSATTAKQVFSANDQFGLRFMIVNDLLMF
jgi:hypothetical protein